MIGGAGKGAVSGTEAAFEVEIRPLGPDSDAQLVREGFPSSQLARTRAAAALRDWAALDVEQLLERLDARDPAQGPAIAALCRTIAERLELADSLMRGRGPALITTSAGEQIQIREGAAT